MSDELEIRGGGAVAVDTTTLRAAARSFTLLAEDLEEIATVVGSAALRLFEVAPVAWDVSSAVETARRQIGAVIADAHDIAVALCSAAAVYEIIELRAERAVADAAGDEATLAGIDARLAVLARDHPDAGRRASLGAFAHALTWPGGLAAQAPGMSGWLAPGLFPLAIPLAWSLQQGVGTVGGGTIPATARLEGSAKHVVIAPVAPRAPATAPLSLADAAARVPGGGDARVRVECYTMPDGSRQFAVYVAGTQTVAPNTRDPFDMTSNVELYTGQRSASFDATRAALADSGAEPGDVVHAFGHSQSAMVVARLAVEGGFDAQTVVSFGSPVEADLGDRTLSISLRHDDDPVAALAAGGHTHAVGGAGSFIASRTADPLPGLHDLGMPAHAIDEYTRTAELLDASADPRMGAVRELFAQLQGAASVDVTEYSAERAALTQTVPQSRPEPTPVSPSSSDAG
ncbi:MAG: hypothetical protein ACXWZG_01970 [Microbacterium sp.]